MNRRERFLANLDEKSLRNYRRGLCTLEDLGFRNKSAFATNKTMPVVKCEFSTKMPTRRVWAVMISDPDLGRIMDDYYYTYEEACTHAAMIPWIYEAEVERIILEEV
jgi:hypothetical protein